MKNYIRIISLLLTVLLMLGSMTALLTVGAFAAEDDEILDDSDNEVSGEDATEEGDESEDGEDSNGEASTLDKATTYKQTVYATPEDKIATMELKRTRGDYELYVDSYSGEVALKNKVTGEILLSNPYDVGASKADESDNSTKEELLSQIIVKFTSTSDNTTNTFLSFREAANREQIRVKNIKNGIRIEYTMGREQAKMLVPMLIEKSRFEDLMATIEKNISPDDREARHQFEKIRSYYNLYDTTNMSKKEQDIIHAQYPATKTMAVYVFNPKATENEIARCENIIKTFAPDYTYEDLEEDHTQTQYVSKDANPPLFKMALEYTLDENGLSVRLPANGIRFNESLYRLESVTVLPYMGAGNNSYEGYNFFPDGSGALFDYQDLNINTAKIVTGKVYGKDFAYHSVTGEYQKPISYPVFGAVEETVYYKYTGFDNSTGEEIEAILNAGIVDKFLDENFANPNIKNRIGKTVAECGLTYEDIIKNPSFKKEVINDHRGFMAIIEEGDALSEISTNHHGAKSEYNSLQIKVTPRPTDTYKLTDSLSVNEENNEWTVVCDKKYVGSYRMRYILLSDYTPAEGQSYKTYDTSWFGMAVAYRDYLMSGDTPILTPLESDKLTGDIPLYIETFGALETLQKVLSVPVKTMTPLTTFEDIKTMYENMSEGDNGIKNVNFKLTGYANGGLESQVPYRFKIENAVGGKRGFQELLNYAADVNKSENTNLGIYPDFEFGYVKYTGMFDGINLNKHVVKTIDDRYASRRTYTATQGMVNYYEMAISPAYFQRFYEKITKTYAQKFENLIGISVASLGNALNSDFDEDEPYNREDSKEFTVGAFKYLDETYNQVMTEGGNAYSWQFVDHILGVALDSSRYNISSESVPFLGVVLHGSVQFAGSPLNMEGNMEYAMLKAIENGASPYFILSYRNTQNLKENEFFSKYYSVRYDIWKEDIVDTYNKLNDALCDVQDKFIIGHEEVENAERVPDLDEIQNDILAEMDKFQNIQENIAEIERQELLNVVSAARQECRDIVVWANEQYDAVWTRYSVDVKQHEKDVLDYLVPYTKGCEALTKMNKNDEGYEAQFNNVQKLKGRLVSAIKTLNDDLKYVKAAIATLNEKVASAYEAVEVIKAAEIPYNSNTPLANQAELQIKDAENIFKANKFAFVTNEISEPSLKGEIIRYFGYDADGKKTENKVNYRVAFIDGEYVAVIPGKTMAENKYFETVEAPGDPDAWEFTATENNETVKKMFIVKPSGEEPCYLDGEAQVYKNRKANGERYYYSKNADGTIADYYFFDAKSGQFKVIKTELVGELDGVKIYVLKDGEGNYHLDSNGNRMYRAGANENDRAEYELKNAVYESESAIKTLIDEYIVKVTAVVKVPDELKITEKEIYDDSESEEDEITKEEEKEESRYATDGIIAVTYGTLDGVAYKTMLLNYNNYMVTLVYDGVRYTIDAYGFVVINK